MVSCRGLLPVCLWNDAVPQAIGQPCESLVLYGCGWWCGGSHAFRRCFGENGGALLEGVQVESLGELFEFCGLLEHENVERALQHLADERVFGSLGSWVPLEG